MAAAGTAVGIRRGHDVLWNVARIEPLVDPSQVWVTERFKDALERTASFYRAEPIEPDVRAQVRSSDGTFNVKKPGSREADHFLRLFRLVEPRRWDSRALLNKVMTTNVSRKRKQIGVFGVLRSSNSNVAQGNRSLIHFAA